MFGKHLAYVALVVREVEAARTLFGELLGLRCTELDERSGKVAVYDVGQSALAVFPTGHPFVGGQEKPGVHHIALTVEDLNRARSEAKSRGIAAGASEPGLAGAERIALEPAETAHVKTWLTTPVQIERSPSRLVERIDHLGIASADNRHAIDAWSGRLQCTLESQQTDMEVALAVESFTSDKYGVVYHTRPPQPIGGLRVAFITVGDCELEFLQNFDPSHGAEVNTAQRGTTRQDQGAITKFIASRGEGLHHVALKTPDINGTLQKLSKAGIPVIDDRGRPGSRRGLIGFLNPRAAGGVLVHFVQRD